MMAISPESQYCLDGACELFDLVPDQHAAAYFAPFDVDAILDCAERDAGITFAERLRRRFEDWYTHEASRGEKVTLGYIAAFESGYQLKEAMTFACDVLIDHYFQSTQRAVGMPLRALPVELTEEAHLVDPTRVREVFEWRSLRLWRCEFDEMCERMATAITSMTVREYLEWWRAQPPRPTPRGYVMMDLDEHPILKRKRKLIPRWRRKQVRKAVVRSAQAASRFVGEKNIRAFIRGETIIVEGARYCYQLRKDSNNLIQHTTFPNLGACPYSLAVLRKADQKRLASACVFFENTPILDQILALSLYVRDHEDESELLKTANLSHLTDQFYEDDFLLCLKGEKRLPEPFEGLILLEAAFGDPEERNRLRTIVQPVVEREFADFIRLPAQALNFLRTTEITFDRFARASLEWADGFDERVALESLASLSSTDGVTA